MLRNYAATVLRNFVRNRITATIAILGLGIAFGSAFLIALFVNDEFTYDTWLPGHELIVRVRADATFPHTVDSLELAPPFLAQALRSDVPAIEDVTRIASSSMTIGQGDIEAQQKIYWADANLFDIFKVPFVAGNPALALAAPESIVLSRAAARRFFGTEDVIGRTLVFNRSHPMNVTGVMEDLPSNTHLDLEVIASGSSSLSNLLQFDSKSSPPNSLPPMVYVYARLRAPVALVELDKALSSLTNRYPELRGGGASIALHADPIADIHLRSALLFGMKENGSKGAAYGFLLIAGLIVLLAAINFTGLAIATVAKRMTEIGVRKVAGADRRHLFWQFTFENLMHVASAMLIGLALAGATLPSFNALLQRSIAFPHGPAWVLGLSIIVAQSAIVAGGFAVRQFAKVRPARILVNQRLTGGRWHFRDTLTVIQFAMLIGLGLAAGAVSAQLRFALSTGLRFDKEQVLQITTSCATAFAQEVRRLPGVAGAACSNARILETGFPAPAIGPSGGTLTASISAVDFGYFELFDLRPIAGRLFSRTFGGDATSSDATTSGQPAIIVNEALVRAMGLDAPEKAIGKRLRWTRQLRAAEYNTSAPAPSEIIGVVPDYARGSVRAETPPTIFWVDPALHRILNLKLDGSRVPETLAAIDTLWRRTGAPHAIIRRFVDEDAQSLYLNLTQQKLVLNCVTAVAFIIASLGLFGLAAFTAEERTKEIGVRKAMGANRRDILKLVLWRFIRPVLLASAIAWPITYFVVRRWLDGFAYHVELAPWMFAAASALALVIALLTVIGHAFLIARARPVTALRYE